MAAQEATLGQLAGWLGRLNGDLEHSDFSKPLGNCAIALAAETKKNFAEGHGPDGSLWPALRFPRAHGRGGDKPLRDFGTLMASFTGRGAKGHVRQITDKVLVFGSRDERAAIHQWGGIITPKNARALTLPLTKEAFRAGSARAMADLFVWRPKGSDHAFLAAEQFKGRGKKQQQRLVLHWLLAKSVTIPVRPSLGFNEPVLSVCDSILAEWAKKKFGEGRI